MHNKSNKYPWVMKKKSSFFYRVNINESLFFFVQHINGSQTFKTNVLTCYILDPKKRQSTLNPNKKKELIYLTFSTEDKNIWTFHLRRFLGNISQGLWNDASEHFLNIDRIQPIENNRTIESVEISFFLLVVHGFVVTKTKFMNVSNVKLYWHL